MLAQFTGSLNIAGHAFSVRWPDPEEGIAELVKRSTLAIQSGSEKERLMTLKRNR
ncbi:hypothetical protein [Pseudomonas saliphila]|uniref:hypothetical protein n=1 Tax=Pseudomonas saliphila TaxID=2586906 RepID=UPI0015B6DF3F|nr:hypothetical protein [Pseudomonas saliphila]